MSKQIVIVAMKTTQLETPLAPSVVKQCVECDADVYVAKKQVVAPNISHKDVDAICLDCYKLMEDETKLTNKERKWLDELRESGKVNMWEAPALMAEEFGYSKSKARVVFNTWAKEKMK